MGGKFGGGIRRSHPGLVDKLGAIDVAVVKGIKAVVIAPAHHLFAFCDHRFAVGFCCSFDLHGYHHIAGVAAIVALDRVNNHASATGGLLDFFAIDFNFCAVIGGQGVQNQAFAVEGAGGHIPLFLQLGLQIFVLANIDNPVDKRAIVAGHDNISRLEIGLKIGQFFAINRRQAVFGGGGCHVFVDQFEPLFAVVQPQTRAHFVVSGAIKALGVFWFGCFAIFGHKKGALAAQPGFFLNLINGFVEELQVFDIF